MSHLRLLILLAVPLACMSPTTPGTGAQLVSPEAILTPHIQKEWQLMFLEQFKKDPKSKQALGYFSSGGWSNDGQALFIDQGEQNLRYMYASPGLNANELDRIRILAMPRADLDLRKIEKLLPLENVDAVSFDNLNWEIVFLKKEAGFMGTSIKINSVYINTPDLPKYPKHQELLKEIKSVIDKSLEKIQ